MSNPVYQASSVGLTLYKEIKRQMLAALAAKEWEPGDVIPAEKQLCLRFGVSVGTLRKAIDELVAENILIRHQGRGTFVALHNRGTHLYRFFNVVRHDSKKFYPTLVLKQFAEKTADQLCSEKLGIAVDSRVFRFTNVRSLNEEPVLVDEITLPATLFPDLTEEKIRDRPSTLYNLYQTQYGLNIIRIEERVRAALSDKKLAKLLNIEVGTPLLQINRIAFTYNDQPVEYRISYVNTQHYEYVPSAP